MGDYVEALVQPEGGAVAIWGAFKAVLLRYGERSMRRARRNEGTLLSQKGRKVRFNPPRDAARAGSLGREGVIVDDVFADPTVNARPPHAKPCNKGPYCWGDYSFCAQLIQFSNDNNRHIRLGYFRRRCGETYWTYAAQTTVSSRWQNVKALLDATSSKVDWFRD